ncbi:MAG: TRAP transporter small permease [Pseudolabrys sp.]
MRRFLDALYAITLWLAAGCLVAIGLLVGVQLASRIVDKLLGLVGLSPLGFIILSLEEFCGFLLAAASFFALAGTLKAGAHIRVTMLLSAVGETWRRYLELWVLGVSAIAAGYIAAQVGAYAFYSWKFNEVSSGVVPLPLFWPQAAMAVGACVLAIALLDEFVRVARGGQPTFRQAEDALTLGKEG